MTVLVWWRGRLQAGEPLHHQETRLQGADVRFPGGEGPNGWPRAVAKQRVFDDYLWWFHSIYERPFRDSPYYADNPDKMPKPVERLAFFSTMQPLINPLNTEPRTYPVKVLVHHEGRHLPIKRSRAFYRLATLEEHRMAFTLHTGMRVSDATPIWDANEIALLAAEQKRIG